ncbi:hypothetical protein D9613_010881 [Agrocybe pediades]|uniref:Uncharacterized protein n=1 Tax=Agrocybe pediades TaxID=84607 RepID=A0A8H4QLP5_9AGAR|nr:hypothetical protein D9613_010881 [Agrocybe pediades]
MSYDQPTSDSESATSRRVDKGKGRAHEPTERTPLLPGTTSTGPTGLGALHEAVTPANSHNRSLRSQLTTVFLVSLLFCLLAFLVLFFLAWSYASRAANLRLEDAIQDGYFVVRGPDHVDVVNITRSDDTEEGEGRSGAGAAIGVNRDEENDGLFRDIWKSIGRWCVRKLDRVSVNISTIRVSPEYDPEITLFDLDVPPLELPLSVEPPNDFSWLTPVSLDMVKVQLSTAHTNVLLDFLKESWKHGRMAVRVEVGHALLRGGSIIKNGGWRRKVRGKLDNIHAPIRLKLPSIPGLPNPGRDVPFPPISDLIQLKSFDVSSDPNSKSLNIRASASVLNPAPPTINLTVPSLPFTISIPYTTTNGSGNISATKRKTVDLASVSTIPFNLTSHPNITVSMMGHVLPISASSFPVLSNFVSRYLSGESNTVLVSSPLIPSSAGLDYVEANFPAPHPKPQILRDVTIREMKIKPTGTGAFLASGTVLAKLILPKGINVGLQVRDVLPDLLIYDGELPPASAAFSHSMTMTSSLHTLPGWHWHKKHRHGDEDEDDRPDLPPDMPIPDPLPEHAFGHLRPDDWVPALSLREDTDGGAAHGAVYAISAKVIDVPLEVLPGRQKEFSNFVGKVVFGSEGATAGLQGVAAVIAEVKGLPIQHDGSGSGSDGRSGTEVMLSGLPFQGNVHIGKKSL